MTVLQAFDKQCEKADVIDIRRDRLILRQHKNENGVCIIPASQDKAARAILIMLGRSTDDIEIEGSKNGDLRYAITPPLTDAEVQMWELDL